MSILFVCGSRRSRYPIARAWALGLLAGVALLSAAVPAVAQNRLGVLHGRVVSEARPVPGAVVELSIQGNVMWRVTADAAGVFRLPALLPARYDLRVVQIGYAEERRRVDVEAGRTQDVVIELTVQAVTIAGVDVSAEALRIERENTEFSTQIQERQIRLMPVRPRASQLVELTPGARADHVWGGATAQANNYELDGLPANHPGVGGELLQPSVNWIESVEVKGLGAGAEYGNFQGGVVNVITKSGDNRFRGEVRSSGETHQFNASNFGFGEYGSETAHRYDFEAELRGPILQDHLFYYVAGQRVRDDRRVNEQRPGEEGEFMPAEVGRDELKFFGKLTWQPAASDRLEASVGRFQTDVEHYGLTGYEAPEAALDLSAPTSFYNLSWRRLWGRYLSTEARFAQFALDETRAPYAGPDVPGIQYYGIFRLHPPEASYQNAPIAYRHNPASTTGTFVGTLRVPFLGQEHVFKAGMEYSSGTFLDQRLRPGGMTWRPARRPSIDLSDPLTWAYPPSTFIPLSTGGEVNLDAAVENSAAFLQTSLALGPRVQVSPGVRYGRWRGWLAPGVGEDRFLAAEDDAVDPRVGINVDVLGDGELIAKAHWGRYHQSMIAQFFDRAQGGNVFTNEDIWYYDGPRFTDPTYTIPPAEWDALVASGDLTRERTFILNETGPVRDYKQPSIDQWLIGVEKTFAGIVRVEGLYVNRRNRDMVALVDLNRATNYTPYERVQVLDSGGQGLGFDGGTVHLDTLYVPNDMILERLRCFTPPHGDCVGSTDVIFPPGFTLADTANLSWDPEYVLTTAPDARRRFDQVQLSLEVARPTWGALGSWVWTRLEGNLDNVTGYDDPSGYGAGPYVRVNEGVSSFGPLSNFSPIEMKASVWGDVGWGVRGGFFWSKSGGDYFAPRLMLTSTGQLNFRTKDNEAIDPGWFEELEGHTVLVGERGRTRLPDRARFDFHLEREVGVGRAGVTLALDVFNIFNFGTPVEYQPMVNHDRNYFYFLPGGDRSRTDPNQYYKAVLERVPPRTVRLGTVIRF